MCACACVERASERQPPPPARASLPVSFLKCAPTDSAHLSQFDTPGFFWSRLSGLLPPHICINLGVAFRCSPPFFVYYGFSYRISLSP